MNISAPLLTIVACILLTPAAANADCESRIEKLRERQAKMPYLDPQRPDLERMRQVAQRLAAQDREALCMELVKELEKVMHEHRDHVENVQEVHKYAAPVDIGSYGRQLDTGQLTGLPVRNRIGDELGVVQGLMIAPKQGRTKALIIEHGGFLGIGATRVQVPWEDVRITRDGSAIVLDMSAGDLQALPDAK